MTARRTDGFCRQLVNLVIDFDLSAGILNLKAEASSTYYTEGASV